jgi:hypothetical protein
MDEFGNSLSDPFGDGGSDGLALSDSTDNQGFDLAGNSSSGSDQTATGAFPGSLGGNPFAPGYGGAQPNYYGGGYAPSYTTGSPSPINGWSGQSSPLSAFSSLGAALFGAPATPSTAATPGVLTSMGLASNGQINTLGIVAIAGVALLAFVALR